MYVLFASILLCGFSWSSASKSLEKDSPASSYYYDHWCGEGLQYLDDAKCAKVFPSNVDYDWSCPISPVATAPANFLPDELITNIKRVVNASTPAGISLYQQYHCLDDRSATTPVETWSSSKIFAIANAAGHIQQTENETAACSSTTADSLAQILVDGKHGSQSTLLGDLATIIASYDTTAGYSSNSLSSYFHDLGWRQRLHDTVLQEWLLQGQNTYQQTLGGNYGEATPSDLGFIAYSLGGTDTVTPYIENNNSSSSSSCPLTKDPWPTVYDNTITSLTAAELVRRIALARDLQPASMQFPGTSWQDMQTILYGAKNASNFFPGQLWGGMTADTAIYLQSAEVVQKLLASYAAADQAQLTQPKSADDQPEAAADLSSQWRIFSKLGAGYSNSRYVGEIQNNVYACLPTPSAVADKAAGNAAGKAAGKVVKGFEFALSIRGSVPQDSSLSQVDKRVMKAMNQAMQFIADTVEKKQQQ